MRILTFVRLCPLARSAQGRWLTSRMLGLVAALVLIASPRVSPVRADTPAPLPNPRTSLTGPGPASGATSSPTTVAPLPKVRITPTPTGTVAPRTPPPPTAPHQPTYGNIQWAADYETSDLSQWWRAHTGNPGPCGDCGPSMVNVVTSPVIQGTHSAKHVVNGTGGTDVVRAELAASQAQTGGFDGQAWYYSWAMYVPSAGQAPWSTAFNLIAQWSPMNFGSLPGCSPPTEMDIFPVGGVAHLYAIVNNQTFTGSGCTEGSDQMNYDMGVLPLDQWVRVTVKVKFGTSSSLGAFGPIWMDSVQKVGQIAARTEYQTAGSYLEMDIYRPDMPIGQSNTIYFDDIKRHDAYLP